MQFPQQKTEFFLSGPAGNIEMATTFPTENFEQIVGIVCHPHPLHGGTMNNKVVTTVAKAFETLGLATVRFNYRGVGKSEGQYADTIGETADLIAIVNWVRQSLPDCKIWLSGFSFGAYISANVANQQKVSQLVSIAPAVNHADFTVLNHINCPWLVIHGDQDEVVPIAEIEAWAEHPPSPLKLIVFPDTSHFFHGKLIGLRDCLIEELKF
jgi:alpha/beta superfamily hydrolase